ncbi:hypothetical protein D3C75_1036500 [compost metagenome]
MQTGHGIYLGILQYAILDHFAGTCQPFFRRLKDKFDIPCLRPSQSCQQLRCAHQNGGMRIMPA